MRSKGKLDKIIWGYLLDMVANGVSMDETHSKIMKVIQKR